MIKQYLILLILLLVGCQQSEPYVTGKMTQSSICSTAGLIIRNNLGKNYKTTRVECTVQSVSPSTVMIDSGYTTPFGSTLRYTALGVVTDDSLKLEKIMIHGVDEAMIPFRDFPG